jgi:hypothetical protein
MRAESLQRRPPRSFEAFVAARTITCVNKKIFAAAPCDDPRTPPSGVTAHVPSVAAVLGGERFVLAVSCDRFQTAAIAAGFSIVTTAAPSPDIPRCSSAPSDVSAEISFCIPSTNTLGFAANVIAASSVALCMGVALSAELTDLDWGSWEGSLPESSSLGGDCTPLRGAFVRLQEFRNSLQVPGRLYQLWGAGDIFIAINSRRPGSFWSAQMAHSFAATDINPSKTKLTL